MKKNRPYSKQSKLLKELKLDVQGHYNLFDDHLIPNVLTKTNSINCY